MEWDAWSPTYEAILADLGFDRGADEAARDELDGLLADRLALGWDGLRSELMDRDVVVIGAAVSKDDITRLLRAGGSSPRTPPNAILVTDGAAATAIPLLRPTAIVTDLDGVVAIQAAANAMGVPLIVHAHGDNRAALREHVPRFRGPVGGTTQAQPHGRVRNFGGFTDGDRACCIAAALGARAVTLVGFDFENPVTKGDAEMKRRKLAWARRIIDGLSIPVRHA